jgi:hypothetical protein
VPLPIQRVDDFVEAREITDQGKIFAMSRLIRAFECSGNDVAKFVDVAQVNAASSGINGKPSPRIRLSVFAEQERPQGSGRT